MRAHFAGVVLGIAAGAALLAVAGCTATATTAAAPPTLAPPTIGPVTNPTSWIAANDALPLIGYDQSTHDQDTLQQAQTILDVDCMHKQGYADFVTSDIAVIQNDAASAAAYRAAGAYGYIDDPNNSNATAHGFHHVSAPATGGVPLPATEQKALADCIRSGRATIDRGAESATSGTALVNELLNQSQAAAGADRRVRSATTAWANCMKAQGFATATDPAALATQQWDRSPNPTSTEIATAVADAGCTRSSNLSGTYLAVEAGYQNELVQANQQALNAIQAANRVEVANAAKIVGTS